MTVRYLNASHIGIDTPYGHSSISPGSAFDCAFCKLAKGLSSVPAFESSALVATKLFVADSDRKHPIKKKTNTYMLPHLPVF